MLIKRKIIYGLISFTLFLIIGNVIIEQLTSKDVKVIKQELPKKVIEELFVATLNDYGILTDWVSKTNRRTKKSDSVDYIYQINIPLDISIASLIKDVNAKFSNQPVEIESIEKKNYSNSEIKIYSNSTLKFDANLIHDRKIKREYSEFAFVVKMDENISDEAMASLKRIYFNFMVAFVPSEFSSTLLNKLDWNYSVILNDEIDDSRFLLDEEFSKQRLDNAIKEIIITYGRKAIYLIDERSKIYNSKIYSMIKDEFEKRGINIIGLSSLTFLDAETDNQLQSLYQFYITSLKGKEGKNFFLNYNSFLSLSPQIERQLKMGDRINLPKFN